MKLNFKQEIVLVKELVWEKLKYFLNFYGIVISFYQRRKVTVLDPTVSQGSCKLYVHSSLFTSLMIIDEGLLQFLTCYCYVLFKTKWFLQDVISNLQQILVKTPPTLTSNTFVTVLHILVLMSSNGSDVGLLLLREKIGETLKRLLIADKSTTNKLTSCPETSSASKEDVELMRRNPQELYEITR